MAFLKVFVRKAIGGLVMIFVVASFTFFLIRLMPGNPVTTKLNALLATGTPYPIALSKVSVMYGFVPNQPVWQQYLTYLGELAHFNLGESISYTGVSVTHIILSAAPWTIIMVLTGVIVSFVLGVLAGVIAAVWRNSWIGQSSTFLATFLHGIPQFMLALVLAYVFTTVWRVFPFGAPYNAAIQPGWTPAFLGSLAKHAVLPVAAYAISGYGGWALTMRSSVTSVLGDEFILAAELRGLTRGLRLRYIARNAFLPLFTTLTLSLGFMFGGSVFIESIFDYPGLGNLLTTSIGAEDYPLMQGAFLLITTAVIVANLLADLLYTAIDPRIRRA